MTKSMKVRESLGGSQTWWPQAKIKVFVSRAVFLSAGPGGGGGGHSVCWLSLVSAERDSCGHSTEVSVPSLAVSWGSPHLALT